ncbi:MAG TPA: translation elongation factor 4 [Phycisphaerae bacterium]|jgi:GTP-binding protein LepA|nr:elongation factor 4 [Phycisphaerae bacterium]HOB73139.1 translation elongation factor 4 [Phycisphaerae bacterium]HOJ53310.1 translation elongation factor 4 [Phycisphaerae bacterium]HOL27196.1 translation elongation factor 4 [Phycisphaerae bacterium]HPP21756.1 translation elongation factor 4 [Phycisphaerae bacterium]
MFDRELIRNFSIIAHIDHGKSTLADRILLATKAVQARQMREQFLDDMDLEREMGITIKANRATVFYELNNIKYMLNLIDTPGHVDFHYEVSRALAACEGVLLLVDATQGVQAQTVANAYKAIEAGLEIIPVINKIDLPTSRPEDVALEVEHVLGLPADQAIFTSAKTGAGIDELFKAVIERIPAPTGELDAPLRALVYDAKSDVHRGVVCHVRIKDGAIRRGDKILLMAAERTYTVTEVGKFMPKPQAVDELAAGEVGYVVAGIKTLNDVNIGDTITLDARRTATPLPGYQPPQRMVFCDFYPGPMTEAPELRDALENLWLNDCSFSFEAVHSNALGFGFRCGFLGLLHMKIIQERIEREANIDVVQTAPTVTYEVLKTDGKVIHIDSPAALPDRGVIQEIREPVIIANLIIPADSIGAIMQMAEDRRGEHRRTEYLSPERVMLTYKFPLSETIFDFYDRLKAATRGYGTMDYELAGYEAGDLVKLDILVNGTPVDALSIIVHREKAERRGRTLIRRLQKEISRHLFEIPLQAAIGGKVIARETIKALRKNVTAKCYGGDVTRKRKLLEKQKEGKKRMKMVGQVNIPQEAFMAVLDPGDED